MYRIDGGLVYPLGRMGWGLAKRMEEELGPLIGGRGQQQAPPDGRCGVRLFHARGQVFPVAKYFACSELNFCCPKCCFCPHLRIRDGQGKDLCYSPVPLEAPC